MNEETQKIIEDQMATLPPEIKTILADFDWATKANELGAKYQLHIDQIGALQTEILMVLIGIVPPDEFENEIKTHLNLPQEKIPQIVNDANEMIFKPVRQALVDIYDQVLTDEDVAEEGAVAPTINTPVVNTATGTDREALLAAIENPPASPTMSVGTGTPTPTTKPTTLETVRIPKQETDYSLVKEAVDLSADKKAIEHTDLTPPPAKIDPYREMPI